MKEDGKLLTKRYPLFTIKVYNGRGSLELKVMSIDIGLSIFGIIYIPLLQRFDTSLLLEVAKSLMPLTFTIVIGIGFAQGVIVGSAIVERFPRLTFHARLASLLLFALFALNAVINVVRFTHPNKLHMPLALSGNAGLSTLSKVIDLSNPLTLLTLSVTMLMFAIFSMIRVRDYKRYFLLTISIVMAFVTSSLVFSDYQPSIFEVLLYSLYQAGIVGGAVMGTRMQLNNKELRFRYLKHRWIGEDSEL